MNTPIPSSSAKPPTIKFSHEYTKLRCQNGTARLLDVLPVQLENLSPAFKQYDTDNSLYALPKRGSYLLLLFEGELGVFTTLRAAWPPSKERFYREKIGMEFQIVIVPPAQ